VELSRQVGVQVQTVAAALEIHPFMLSKWRKEFRDGRMRRVVSPTRSAAPLREVKRLEAVERAHARLQEEHELLKKAIRFWSAQKARPSPLSTPSARL
jgi:transposase